MVRSREHAGRYWKTTNIRCSLTVRPAGCCPQGQWHCVASIYVACHILDHARLRLPHERAFRTHAEGRDSVLQSANHCQMHLFWAEIRVDRICHGRPPSNLHFDYQSSPSWASRSINRHYGSAIQEDSIIFTKFRRNKPLGTDTNGHVGIVI